MSVSVNDFVVRAVAVALRRVPEANGKPGPVQPYQNEGLWGIAILFSLGVPSKQLDLDAFQSRSDLKSDRTFGSTHSLAPTFNCALDLPTGIPVHMVTARQVCFAVRRTSVATETRTMQLISRC